MDQIDAGQEQAAPPTSRWWWPGLRRSNPPPSAAGTLLNLRHWGKGALTLHLTLVVGNSWGRVEADQRSRELQILHVLEDAPLTSVDALVAPG
jgi:hypothetical protein